MSFIITIFVLGVVVFVHELGHMLMAKRAGIGVLEFAVGMGPVVYSIKTEQTLYSLRCLPFGGFVKLAGLDEEDIEKVNLQPENSYYRKPVLSRFLTIVSGSLVNIFFGFIVYVLIFALTGVPEVTNTIEEVVADSPAFEAGLKKGDTILSVNGYPVLDTQKDLVEKISKSRDMSVLIEFRSEDQAVSQLSSRRIVPEDLYSSGEGKIGVYFRVKQKRFNPVYSLWLASKETVNTVKLVFVSLNMLINGKVGLNELAGPIGIIQIASYTLKKGFLSFLNIIAMISISLGVINLFPFPVLDGGHVVLLGIEAVRKKRLSKKLETMVNNTGASILIALMLFIIVNDVINWKDRIVFLKKILDF
ncbi:MAG: RIP metalloprotease RseP [bacterium]|nr:RIP metalloprotease RseP [bacterium]